MFSISSQVHLLVVVWRISVGESRTNSSIPLFKMFNYWLFYCITSSCPSTRFSLSLMSVSNVSTSASNSSHSKKFRIPVRFFKDWQFSTFVYERSWTETKWTFSLCYNFLPPASLTIFSILLFLLLFSAFFSLKLDFRPFLDHAWIGSLKLDLRCLSSKDWPPIKQPSLQHCSENQPFSLGDTFRLLFHGSQE